VTFNAKNFSSVDANNFSLFFLDCFFCPVYELTRNKPARRTALRSVKLRLLQVQKKCFQKFLPVSAVHTG